MRILTAGPQICFSFSGILRQDEVRVTRVEQRRVVVVVVVVSC